MPILTLKFNEQKVNEYPLDEVPVTIGRRKDNVVAIDNLAVSSHHAKIEPVDNGFLLVDLKSLNGTFLNEQRVNTAWLSHGDTITIGKHTLVFTCTAGEAKPDPKSAKIDATMFLDTQKHREMLESQVSNLRQQNTKEPLAVLSFLVGGEGEIELSKKLTKIGKDSASDIVISGWTTGKTAVTISKRNNGFFLSYAGGMSKPRVNDQKVKGSVRLKEFDIIQIGAVKMQLIYKNES